ncbi:hypothetical protein [Silvibacterium dinghuense]|uniref:Uncharacterized protein n=1 Tax=Silvibacterium dinghuense TaxID=1560006 RepID=A0A4Q1SII9_9BACT|nr:hypothetical protein [Silvibacterium dinghuense]RXS97416.1 hypothetical protein ESZ00_05835 [Silvibacterium dinghuense]GGG98848.1 hypothetical protein GCM10011586_12900 [Silvibacterium dinghuense]
MNAPHSQQDSARPAEMPAEAQHIPHQRRIEELESENRRLLTLVGELLMTNQRLREQFSKNGCGQPVAAR